MLNCRRPICSRLGLAGGITVAIQPQLPSDPRRRPPPLPPRGSFQNLSPIAMAGLGVGVLLILIALIGAQWAWQRRSAAQALQTDSTITTGKVTRLWVTGPEYHVAYQYPTNERTIDGESEIAEREYKRLEVGGPVAVKVCRSDPALHLVHGARPPAFSGAAALPVTLLAFAIV